MLRGMFSTPFLRIFLYFECLLVENVTINLEEQKKTFSLRLIYYTNSLKRIKRGSGSSRAREFHPLTEPCVKVSPHTALHTQGRFYKLALMGFCSISEQISL